MKTINSTKSQVNDVIKLKEKVIFRLVVVYITESFTSDCKVLSVLIQLYSCLVRSEHFEKSELPKNFV